MLVYMTYKKQQIRMEALKNKKNKKKKHDVNRWEEHTPNTQKKPKNQKNLQCT